MWRRFRAGATIGRRQADLDVSEPTPETDRWLSPSDFGFHNALLPADGRLRFIDFEYAGWDDPAKLVCDFFCQPDVPAPAKYLAPFTDLLLADLSDPLRHRRRIAMLLPVYRVKWCCILMNEYLPAGRERRSFAAGIDVDQDARLAQLDKARRMLRSVDEVMEATV